MIRVRNLAKRFGNREVLKGVSFEVRRGEVLGLVGPAGAGKTTVVRLLTTVLEPSAGAIEIDDPDIPQLPAQRGYKARIGYQPDDPFLFDYLTGREMLYFMATLYQVPPSEIEGRVSFGLQLMEMTAHADSLMRGYSRGMRRKISFLGSMLHQPLYWYLDEPAESLDSAALRRLAELVDMARDQDRAVVLATRRCDFAETLCDRIVALEEGSAVFEGAPGGYRFMTEGSAGDVLTSRPCLPETGPGSRRMVGACRDGRQTCHGTNESRPRRKSPSGTVLHHPAPHAPVDSRTRSAPGEGAGMDDPDDFRAGPR